MYQYLFPPLRNSMDGVILEVESFKHRLQEDDVRKVPNLLTTYCDREGHIYTWKGGDTPPYRHFSLLQAYGLEANDYIRFDLDGSKYYAHRLIAETFLDKPDCACSVDHIDRNRGNNRLGNLRWQTPIEQRMN